MFGRVRAIFRAIKIEIAPGTYLGRFNFALIISVNAAYLDK